MSIPQRVKLFFVAVIKFPLLCLGMLLCFVFDE